MIKANATVRRETGYIALWVVIFSLLLQAVFLIIGQWSLPVLWGNLLGGAASVLNFFLMGLTVQKAVEQDEKKAAATLRLSQSGRFMMMAAVGGVGALAPLFSIWTTLIPLLFPRIGIALRPLFGNVSGAPAPTAAAGETDEDEDEDI